MPDVFTKAKRETKAFTFAKAMVDRRVFRG